MSDELRSAINFVKSLDPRCMGIGYLPHDAGTYPLSAELIHRLEIAQSELQALRKVAEAVGRYTPAHLRAWAKQFEDTFGYKDSAITLYLYSLADALAEWESNQ